MNQDLLDHCREVIQADFSNRIAQVAMANNIDPDLVAELSTEALFQLVTIFAEATNEKIRSYASQAIDDVVKRLKDPTRELSSTEKELVGLAKVGTEYFIKSAISGAVTEALLLGGVPGFVVGAGVSFTVQLGLDVGEDLLEEYF